MTQRMYIGHQGSGKTWRAIFDFLKVEADIAIFLDTKNSIKDYKHSLGDVMRIRGQYEIDWENGGRFVVPIDPDKFYFPDLIDIIENETGLHGGVGRKVHLTIDEAYIYTMQHGELCERMALWSRSYYDIDWISQRVQMLRTPHGSTIFTQIDKYFVFFINKFERDYLKDAAGLELDDEEVAWLSPIRTKLPFHYVAWNNIIKEYYNEKGDKSTDMTCPCRKS